MVAYSKEEPRFFRFIQEKITLKPSWSESSQIGSDNGCWLALNEDGSTHIVQGTTIHPTGWRVLSREYPAEIVLAEKNIVDVEEAPLGEFTLQTLDGEMAYNNINGGYIVYNTYQGHIDKEDKWFMTKEIFDKKYSFEPLDTHSIPVVEWSEIKFTKADSGDKLTLENFKSDYDYYDDGTSYYGTDTHISNLHYGYDDLPDWATHIYYYGK